MMTLKAIADGQLATSKATLYTCPAGSTVLINSVILTNTDPTNARTVNLYVNRSGTSRKIVASDKSLALNESVTITPQVVLEAGDLLEGDASAATTVDYVVSGAIVN